MPGQFVSQGELCELLDVPLGPTREALKRLEAESLVRLIPQRGIQIADIGVTLIHEAFEFRTILELAAVRRFAVTADDATLAGARAATPRGARANGGRRRRRMRKLLDAALQVDWGMHNLMIESIGNRILIDGAPAELRQDQDDPAARPLAALPAARDGGASCGDRRVEARATRRPRRRRSSSISRRGTPRAGAVTTLAAAGAPRAGARSPSPTSRSTT